MGIGFVMTFVLFAFLIGLLSRQVVTTNSEQTQSDEVQHAPESPREIWTNAKDTTEQSMPSNQAQAQ
ncbi:hypothetical protein SAMN04489725_10360 [Alicyclobacillus hesperidum]|uniref:Uncharacterized protein n=1 Tax=Alicyclobacillus hesperidum TaxID=89784 RepID=A0A1H2RM50_9BACL|nr:hypothetical protein [Alicyclobacillus hesperidum]SDW20563.1 hypothetical protein SAMN04489725_10360 [Alicyclobacillus hesperidum]